MHQSLLPWSPCTEPTAALWWLTNSYSKTYFQQDEVKDWVIPPDYDHVEAEAKHLVREADTDGVRWIICLLVSLPDSGHFIFVVFGVFNTSGENLF